MTEMTQEEMIAAQKAQCPFCKIIKGEIPSKKVYEDEHMIAILDINPAAKGHLLVMPKEHYPILPLIPPEIFKHVFVQTKKLMHAMHKGLIVPKVTTFIANGAAAGQQSPHFLYHLIPRESGDGLDQLDALNGSVAQKDVAQTIGANMQAIMQRSGANAGSAVQQQPQNPQERVQAILSLLEQEPQLHDLLLKDPSQVEEFVKQNPTLQQAFAGVNLTALSEMLKQQAQMQQETASQEDVPVQEAPQEEVQQPEEKTIVQKPSKEISAPTQTPAQDVVPDAASLSDEELTTYVESKPILKELLHTDMGKLMEQLETNPRLQTFFATQTPQEVLERVMPHEDEDEQEEKESEVDFAALSKYLGGNK